jgi:divalent metal cation (Fe/Co/Zn/Cd) transporter
VTISNPGLATEAHVTLIDAYLAGAVLVGLVLTALFDWWWADPLAGLVIVYYGAREGWEAWHHEVTRADTRQALAHRCVP